jgi:PAS domain S-box-containing protein
VRDRGRESETETALRPRGPEGGKLQGFALVVDQKGRIALVAGTLAGAIGLPRLLGRSLLEAEEDLAWLASGVHRALGGESFRSSRFLEGRAFDVRYAAIPKGRDGPGGAIVLARGSSEAARVAFAVTNSQGAIVAAEGGPLEVVVATRSAAGWVGRSALEVLRPDGLALSGLRQALAGVRAAFARELDGTSGEVRFAPLEDAPGKVAGVALVAIESGEPSRRVEIERIPALLWTTDRALHVSGLAGALAWLPGGRPTGRGHELDETFESAGLSDEPSLSAHRRALRGEGVSYRFESRGRWLSARVEPLVDAEGKLLGCIGAALSETRGRPTEHEIARALSLVQSTLEATADGILVTDTRGEVMRFNRRLGEMWRLPEDALAAGDWERLIPVGLDQVVNPEAFWARIQELRANPDVEAFDIIRFKDGRRFEGVVRPQRVGGTTIGRVLTFRDMTARARAEEEFTRNVSLLRAALDSTADGILIVDLEGKIARYNGKFVEIWRLGQDILATRDDERALAAAVGNVADPEGFLERVRELYAQPEAESFDTIEFRDGRIIERYSQPQRIAGTPVGRVWSFRDVTTRVRAEREAARLLVAERAAHAEAAAARERSEFLAEASRVLADSLDNETTLRIVARLALPSLADYCIIDVVDPPSGAIRRLAVEHRDPAKADLVRDLQRFVGERDAPIGVANVLRTGQPEIHHHVDEERLDQPTGWSALGSRDAAVIEAYRRVGIRALMCVPLTARGVTLGVLSFVSEDDPDRFGPIELSVAMALATRAALAVDNVRLYAEARAAARDAREAVGVRDEFIDLASHELKTPLTALQVAIQTLARVLQNEWPDAPSAVGRSIAAAERQTQRFGKLVDNLLNVSRISIGRFTCTYEDVDVANLVRETVARFSVASGLPPRLIAVQAPERSMGRWDRLGLERVLENLLSNAVKFGAGKPIDVLLRDEGGTVRLEVRDRGDGIAPELQERLFERFPGAGAGKHTSGLGLGLFIVRGIAEAHGGRVSFKSAPGRGSTLSVVLPRVPPAAARAA